MQCYYALLRLYDASEFLQSWSTRTRSYSLFAVRLAVAMRISSCNAAHDILIRNNVNPVVIANFRQASHATHTINGMQHSKPCQRLNSVRSRRKINIVAARTESTDMPTGEAVPDFEVGLVCTSRLSRCN